MPFTPLHFGPGLLLKAVFPRSFWLTSFLAANVLIDIEVLVYLAVDDPPLHRHLHTYLGGVVIGFLAGLLVYLAVWSLRVAWASSIARSSQIPRRRTSMIQSLAAGFLGGVSHVFLDSIMHRDVQPLWPLSTENAAFRLVSTGSLHMACIFSGFFGLVFWLLLRQWTEPRSRSNEPHGFWLGGREAHHEGLRQSHEAELSALREQLDECDSETDRERICGKIDAVIHEYKEKLGDIDELLF